MTLMSASFKVLALPPVERILIPKDLISHAKISKEIVVSSAVNILEIWDKDSYENAIDDAKIDFGNLAEEVMGDKKDENVS